MLYVSWQDQWQRNSYQQNSPDGLKSGEESVTKMVTYHDNSQTYEYPTELLNELGTTDVAIGDATAETMLTTIGKPPKEMFYVEETTSHMQSFTHKYSSSTSSTSMSLITTHGDTTTKPGLNNHSSIFLILIITLLVLLLLCCITACIISKTKRKAGYFRRCGFQECDLECKGVKQPLLSTEKLTESTSKTDSTKN